MSELAERLERCGHELGVWGIGNSLHAEVVETLRFQEAEIEQLRSMERNLRQLCLHIESHGAAVQWVQLRAILDLGESACNKKVIVPREGESTV